MILGVRWLPVLALLVLSTAASAREVEPAAIEFTLSARRAAEQRYDVVMRCGGVTGESLGFSLPVWTPGYYQLMTYAKQIEGFSATDGAAAPWRGIRSTATRGT